MMIADGAMPEKLSVQTFLRPMGIGILLVPLLLSGCLTDLAFREARDMVSAGQVEAGLARVEQLVVENPTHAEYKSYLLRQQELRAGKLLAQGQTALINEDFPAALAAFSQVLTFDRNNGRAQAGLRLVEDGRRHQGMLQRADAAAAKDPEEALSVLRTVLSENPAHAGALRLKRRIEAERHQEQLLPPRLSANFKKQVTLQFRDASLSEVFQALAQTSDLSFVFDKDVQTTSKVTLFANKMSVEDALAVLLATSQLEKKVIGDSAVLIYPNNPTKKADYQDNIVKSFYIGNADPKQTMNMVKSLARSRDVFIDEKLGLMTVRDSLDNIRIIERLVAAQDLIDPEVLLEVEVMEVATTRLQALGIRYPDQLSLSTFTNNAAFVAANASPPYLTGTTTLRELRHLNDSRILSTITDPALILNLKATDGVTNLLANPRIRVKNREKAKIRIGDKVPVITTTTASTGVTSESVAYLDVGLALDVDPVIHPDNQVTMKMALEVSNVVKEVTSKSGLLTYQIGNRRAETVLRLKDGETQVLAGLIRREERDAAARVPGLGDLPVVGRLFSSTTENLDKTEIVLLVTPRIVRRTELPPVHVTEFSSGSDNYASINPLRLQSAAKLSIGTASGAPAAGNAPPPPPPMPGAPGGQPGADAAVVTFTLEAPPKVQVGQTADLRINATLRQDVKVINLEIDFDPNRFEFAAGALGQLMGSSGGTPQLETIVETPGRLRFISQNAGGAKGAGHLATLSFKAKAAGPEPAFIGFGGIYALDISGNQVTIMSPDPRPIVVMP